MDKAKSTRRKTLTVSKGPAQSRDKAKFGSTKRLRGHDRILSEALANGDSIHITQFSEGGANPRIVGKLMDYDPYSLVVENHDHSLVVFKASIKTFFTFTPETEIPPPPETVEA